MSNYRTKVKIYSVGFLEKVLETSYSLLSGEIRVIKSLAWGTFIQIGGITQSGGVVEQIWKDVVKKINGEFDNILILGFGGGSVAKILRKKFKDSKIVGVEIDPLMVKMGKKYLGMSGKIAKVYTDDALNWLLRNRGRKFDLIVVDVYQGKVFPKKFESDNFLNLAASFLSEEGILIFNRLYTSDLGVRKSALRFGEKLEKKFKRVVRLFPCANLIFLCSKA